MLFSIIIPCYNEAESLEIFRDRLEEIKKQIKEEYKMDVECIYIDDGSSDNTHMILKAYHLMDSSNRYISFSRNFGKESAILAGLKSAKGDLVGMIDADLQDPPELILDMLHAIIHESYDCAVACRITRKGEPKIRSFFARRFYRMMNRTSNIKMRNGSRDFRVMKRIVVDAILELCEYNRFSKGIFSWVGFSTKWIEYPNQKRVAGKTKWSFQKLWKYAVDGLMSFSTLPLTLVSILGIFFFMIALLGMVFVVIRKILFGDPVVGWASLVSIILFISSVQLLSLGIIGEYIAKTYLEVKKRPAYIIKETENSKKDEK